VAVDCLAKSHDWNDEHHNNRLKLPLKAHRNEQPEIWYAIQRAGKLYTYDYYLITGSTLNPSRTRHSGA
jgi:hypothetical protein